MSNAMQHWNRNQVVVIDVETTGLMPGYHEIWQLSAVALDSNLIPRQDVRYLDMLIAPEIPDYIDWKVPVMQHNKERIIKAMTYGLDSEHAKDVFEDWLKTLGLPLNMGGFHRCKIMPLGHNIAQFDLPFIKAWLGPSQYDEWFHAHVRDTMILGAYLNDKAAMRAEKVPFSKLTLAWMCKQYSIELPAAHQHNALHDCVATGQLYERLVVRGLPV